MQPQTKAKILTVWLSLCLLAVTGIMIAHGTARLRQSGNSISDMKETSDLLFPDAPEKIAAEFQKYKSLPEFQKAFPAMEAEEFATIYWLEYSTALLKRLFVPLVILPFMVFIAARIMDGRRAGKLAAIFICGCLLPLVHLYLVKNGALYDMNMAAYRISTEIALQFLFFFLILWQTLSISYPGYMTGGIELAKPGIFIKMIACVVFAVLCLEIIMGGSLSSIPGNLKYNIFPAAEDGWLPDGLFPLQPYYKNLFEDVTTIKFAHRFSAYVLAGLILLFWLLGRNNPHIAHLLPILFSIFVIQFLLGLLTLLFAGPVRLSSLHQVNTILLFAIAVTILHRLFIPIKSINY